MPMHMQHILKDLLAHTFFTIQGVPTICQTTRGTRPGDPVADVLFNLCMAGLLQDFRTSMQQTTDAPWLGHAQPITDMTTCPNLPPEGYADVTFVDDCAILLHGRSNDKVIELIQAVVTAIDQAAAFRGLAVNYDPGKTEVLWAVAGKGAKAAKVQLHQDHNVLKWQANGKQYGIHVCHAYKHLGTWLQTKHRHAREIRARGQAAKQQWGQLARSFFTKKAVSMQAKSKVFQSLVISKMVYNAHTWTGVTPKDMDMWTNYLKAPAGTLLKGMLHHSTRFQHTTDEMMAYAGILPLQDQVHAQRLRFLARLLAACPPITWMI